MAQRSARGAPSAPGSPGSPGFGIARDRETTSEPGVRRERSPAPAGEVPRLLQLGTTLGNRTTTALLAGGLLQRKVAIGPADDPLEREADRVAERVLAQPEAAAAEGPAQPRATAGAVVQRACAACTAGGQPCAECAKEKEDDDEEQRRPSAAASPAGQLQRRCADCEDDEEEIQRQAAGPSAAAPAPAQLDSHLAALGPGRPLSPGLRSYFEPRFGHDLGAVRLHTGTTADGAARAARARAFTLRQDVVFAAGEYTPATRGGRRLLAHELAHVVQQAPPAARRLPVLRREESTPAPEPPMPAAPEPESSTPPAAGPDPAAQQTPETTPEPSPQQQAPAAQESEGSETAAAEPESGEAPRGLIVADDAQPGPEQMTRSAFLDELHTAACTAAQAGLAGTERSAKGCPWIDYYFRLYRGMSAERIEADLLRYVPATRGAATARDYIAPTAEHIHESVRRWAETGELSGVPEGLPGMGLLGAIGGSLAGLGRMLFKARPGGARGPAQPAAVAARLGPGSPLAGSARSRMERAFGGGLGGVRVHTDTTAARLAGHFNARAFTVGRHVAFGRGEYRPGTPAGDALLAHELAHTVQQRAVGDAAAQSTPPASAPLERDADRSAVGAVAGLWAGTGRLSRQIVPRLRSGLSLQRCCKDKKKTKVPTDASCAPPADAAEVAKLKEGLISTFKLSGVVELEGTCWSKDELKKVRKGLDQLSPTQREAIAGVTLKRVKSTTCDGSPPGCFQQRLVADTAQRQDAIELADEAFKGAAVNLPPVEDIVLHEVGHAVESVDRRAAEVARQKSNLEVERKNQARAKAVLAFNNAIPPGGADALAFDSKTNEGAAYGRGLLAVNREFTKISKVLDGIGNDPSSTTLTEAATKIGSQADDAEKAIASIDKLRAALLKRQPDTKELKPAVEQSFKDRLKAARAVVEATKAQVEVQKKFEGAKVAEKATTAKIPLAGEGKVLDATQRLAQLVALVEIKKIDVKASPLLKDYPKDNWPQRPGELFADLFQMSVSEPKKLRAFDPDVADFFTEPIGAKGEMEKRVATKVGSMGKSAARIEGAKAP